MKCTIHKCTQPAQLSHITYNQHLIGCDDNYTALTPSAMELLTEMVLNYRDSAPLTTVQDLDNEFEEEEEEEEEKKSNEIKR